MQPRHAPGWIYPRQQPKKKTCQQANKEYRDINSEMKIDDETAAIDNL